MHVSVCPASTCWSRAGRPPAPEANGFHGVNDWAPDLPNPCGRRCSPFWAKWGAMQARRWVDLKRRLLLPIANIATDALALIDAFQVVQEIRLAHQVEQLNMGIKPDDVVALSDLPPVDRAVLAETATQRRTGQHVALRDAGTERRLTAGHGEESSSARVIDASSGSRVFAGSAREAAIGFVRTLVAWMAGRRTRCAVPSHRHRSAVPCSSCSAPWRRSSTPPSIALGDPRPHTEMTAPVHLLRQLQILATVGQDPCTTNAEMRRSSDVPVMRYVAVRRLISLASRSRRENVPW